jgi:pimeloyl-ACP methyl ester carboxylesterase
MYASTNREWAWASSMRLVLAVVGFALAMFSPLAALHAAPAGIQEEAFVPIGGIDQWITIKGDDRDNPVLLFLHGGPGDAASPFADAMFAGWEKDFTLVQWDQRGAGRTFGKTGPSIAPTMTMKRMTQDGIEVAAYLVRHLGKKKIILTGGSWGSILGVNMVRARPSLFYAYVGTAQVVSWQKMVAESYARVLEMARAANDQPAISALSAIGSPPWNSLRTWAQYRKWQRPYQAKLATAPSGPEAISPAYASEQERKQWAEADDFNFVHFVGLDTAGPLTKVDLAAQGTDFAIPVFFIQGEQDLTAPPDLVKAYFDDLRAPEKKFYVVPDTGHNPSAAFLQQWHKVLVEQVRSLALGN